MRPDLTPPENTLRALRRLPAEEAPPYGWEEFQRRARLRVGERQRPHRAARAWDSLPGWAVAAGLAVLGVGLVTDVHWRTAAVPAELPAAPVRADSGVSPGVAAETSPGQSVATAPAAAVKGGAVDAERADYRQPAIVQVDTQVTVSALEDRIAAVDDLITAARLKHPRAQQVLALQRDRDQMVESLNQIRRAQLLVAELR